MMITEVVLPAFSQCSNLLKAPAEFSGPTVFSGKTTSVKIITTSASDGIYFKRVDLKRQPLIKATASNVLATPRTTILGTKDCHVMLVEHLMAVLFVYGISQAVIEIDGPEVPIGDGSAMHIVEAIESAGIEFQDLSFEKWENPPLFLEIKDQLIAGLPSHHFKVSYTLQYKNHPLLDSQFYTFDMSLEAFKKEIAPSRTFALKSEVDELIARGQIKGTSLDYGIVIDGERILNPNGLKFADEMVKHKILDLLGDFALAELRPSLHIVAIKSGHSANVEFAKLLINRIKSENHYGL
jgi:UDP-3-O-[3-hydroxymyristoyl] N-acetylglucosamine deacetylase